MTMGHGHSHSLSLLCCVVGYYYRGLCPAVGAAFAVVTLVMVVTSVNVWEGFSELIVANH